MDQHPDSEPLDLSLQLPRDMYHQLIHTLRASLPPPATDSPEDQVRRENAAISHVACLLPANADEANLASLYIDATAQAHACSRLASANPDDVQLVLKFTAMSANLMRQARGFRTLLIRVQALRQKREADAAATQSAAWIEHCAIGLMANALGRPAPAPVPATEPEPPPPAPAAPERDNSFATLSEADQYAVLHPRRAALIRAHGGLPPKCDFGPPEPDLVHDIATGTSPILRALDAPAEPAFSTA
jgi:hypothetical protein